MENGVSWVWFLSFNLLLLRTYNLFRESGILRFSKWTKDFTRSTQPQEYWRDQTLFEIASAFGTPLIIDVATQKRTIGHYL